LISSHSLDFERLLTSAASPTLYPRRANGARPVPRTSCWIESLFDAGSR
jgi:hypothetical protein